MLWKNKEEEGAAGPIRVDRTLYRIVGQEWELLPQSNHWVRYMAVMRRQGDNHDLFDVRIYDEWSADQKGLKVTNYESLDFHPELVIFNGWVDRRAKTGAIHLNRAQISKVA